jgi:glucuronoarabinoxylan endo-1,4-beta-xylanase
MISALKETIILFFLFPVMLVAQNVTVDFSKTYQKIDGFGGSSAWSGKFKDSTMDLIYGNGANQLGFTILRLRIDPSADKWSDEKSNAEKAKKRGAMVFATPWSAPESLKTNGNVKHGSIIATKYQSYANWLKSFWNFVGDTNIDIISIQNEPDFDPDYEGCQWNATQFLTFCKTYAPLIGKPIMMPESFGSNFALSDPTLNDATAAANITYIGEHLYGAQPKTYTKALDLGKHVWMTEFNQDDDSPAGVMTIAKQVLDCMYNSFSGYVWWWMLDWGNGLVTSKGETKKKSWAIAQFAKWVRPGYYRVDATYNPQTDVYVVAFKGTQNVVVAINRATSSKTLTIKYSNATVTSVQKYTSSTSKNAVNDGTINSSNNSFSATLDAQSTTTFVSAGSTPILPFRIENRNSTEKVINPTAQSNVPNYFMYMLNGKRGLVHVGQGLVRMSSGVYVFPNKYNSTTDKAGTRVLMGTKDNN